ncbi:MAG: peptidylprolyl isomerase [Cyanobacteria bacterium QH_8_48_120]|jgi:peptidyl-prolyl cis-trans isomerase B (cyclophilin B)|nr:MAG: peptidylprolyl isomerase [Cyanobacteria bacterium QH_1_48_107]PSO56821.1 MAG: peptidylprolyl isomerase [Cyanobacteria bacterium QH_7_48_89]PSO64087.1 MAG: peptidylprolyl isomerase [Cyanobacteria bacterium QH_6_48_35]PSO69971.1 MAG: peptidylprolyl isomerase [Cyanobacteria bacterium QH_8_48_120]PSO75209.1 MAG: peptidylprolyl isomerase [Cyanobacteria bacterium QH_3_48_40]PSO92627.1 MAG: peptidylprolyl isomerase [Cyanobacteria bacterium SW_6_48_11]PSO93622.1 MAG: peptidylprolyl isomerase 
MKYEGLMVRRWLTLLFSAIVVSTLALGGCQTQQPSFSTPEDSEAITTPVSTKIIKDLPKLEGKATVVLTINDSPVAMEVNGDRAPITAGNFVGLVERGFYDGLTFHRVAREPQPFVVQGGDPKGNGTGGFINPQTNQRRSIPLEIEPEGAEKPIYGQTFKQAGISAEPALKHTRGSVSMARSQMPNSASSQFFIALADLPFLDGNYAVFGNVTEGMEVVEEIQKGDRIQSAKVIEGLEKLKK